MISSEYVSRLVAAIDNLEWARREICQDPRVKGNDEDVQDINHIINQLTFIIEGHCKQNVGEE